MNTDENTNVNVDVVNGERNKIFVTVENQSELNITLKNVAGSFHHPETNALVKNVCEEALSRGSHIH